MKFWGYYCLELQKVLNVFYILKEVLIDFYRFCDILFKVIDCLNYQIIVDEEYICIYIFCRDK